MARPRRRAAPALPARAVDWYQLQPDAGAARRPATSPPTAACAALPPCGAFSGIARRAAARSRALQRAGLGVPQVVIVIAGVPDWAASPASGCERDGRQRATSRPITAAGPGGLPGADRPGRRAGGARGRDASAGGARGTSPTTRRSSARSARRCSADVAARWRRPSTPSSCSPPRPRWTPCPATSSSSSARWPATTVATPRRSTVAEMVAALPDDVACASRTWSQHDYAQITPGRGQAGPGRRAGAGARRAAVHEGRAHLGDRDRRRRRRSGRAATDRRRLPARAVPRPGRGAAPLGRRSPRRRGVPVHLPRGHGLSRSASPTPASPGSTRPTTSGPPGAPACRAPRRPRCRSPAPEAIARRYSAGTCSASPSSAFSARSTDIAMQVKVGVSRLVPGRGLGRAQALHEVEERAGVVGLEGDDELLVVEPERVARVDVDARVLAADRMCSCMIRQRSFGSQPVPLARLHERVDEQVLARARRGPRARLVGVLRRLGHRQERVGRRRPSPSGPLWASTTWNSWMRSRFSAWLSSIRSASPRVPTSENARSRRSSPKSSQAARNSRLCCARSDSGRRRQAGSTLQERVLDEVAVGHARASA